MCWYSALVLLHLFDRDDPCPVESDTFPNFSCPTLYPILVIKIEKKKNQARHDVEVKKAGGHKLVAIPWEEK
eukprot:g6814.t1